MVTFSTLWATTLAKVEAQGVDCEVTYQPVSLVAADGVTGQYGESFGSSTIHLIVGNTDGSFTVLGVGTHNQLSQTAYTDTAVTEGSRILDKQGDLWAITAVKPSTVGDVITHYVATLHHIQETGSAVPEVNPPLPPRYSGIMGLAGYFETNSISEEGHVYGEDVSNAISEHGHLYGEDASNTISETGTSEALTPTITYVGATNATANNSLGDNWTLPGGWAAGDLAVFWWYTTANTKTVTEPAEVTQLQDASAANYGRMFIGYRVLQVGDAVFAWTSSDVANSDVIWGASVFHDANAAPIGNELTPATFTDITGGTTVFPLTISTDMSAMFMFYGKRNDYTSITAPIGAALCGSGSSTAGTDASAGAAYILALKNTSYAFSGFTLGGGGADEGYVYALEIKT